MHVKPQGQVKAVEGQAAPAAVERPSAQDVAKKAQTATAAQTGGASEAAAHAVLTGSEPKTITLVLPAGARRVENPELPAFLQGAGATIKASFVFDTPVSLGSLGGVDPNLPAPPGPSRFTKAMTDAVASSPTYKGDMDKFKADLTNYATIDDVAPVKAALAEAMGLQPGTFGLDCGKGHGSVFEDSDWYRGTGVCVRFSKDNLAFEYNFETGKASWRNPANETVEKDMKGFLAAHPDRAAVGGA